MFLDFKPSQSYTFIMKEILRQLREEKKLSQKQLAEIAGVSRLAYLKYEAGEVEPPVSVIRKLAEFYHVSYETLIDNMVKNYIQYHPVTDFSKLYVTEATPAYSSTLSQSLDFPEAEIEKYKLIAAKNKLTLVQFFLQAAASFTAKKSAAPSLTDWQPLSLGTLKSDYVNKDYQQEMLDDRY